MFCLNIQNISICSYNISNNNHIHCNMTTVLQETKESFVSQSKSDGMYDLYLYLYYKTSASDLYYIIDNINPLNITIDYNNNISDIDSNKCYTNSLDISDKTSCTICNSNLTYLNLPCGDDLYRSISCDNTCYSNSILDKAGTCCNKDLIDCAGYCSGTSIVVIDPLASVDNLICCNFI